MPQRDRNVANAPPCSRRTWLAHAPGRSRNGGIHTAVPLRAKRLHRPPIADPILGGQAASGNQRIKGNRHAHHTPAFALLLTLIRNLSSEAPATTVGSTTTDFLQRLGLWSRRKRVPLRQGVRGLGLAGTLAGRSEPHVRAEPRRGGYTLRLHDDPVPVVPSDALILRIGHPGAAAGDKRQAVRRPGRHHPA